MTLVYKGRNITLLTAMVEVRLEKINRTLKPPPRSFNYASAQIAFMTSLDDVAIKTVQ